MTITNSEQEVNVNFSGVNMLTQWKYLNIIYNKKVKFSSCESFKSLNVKQLDLRGNSLENFNLSCLPKTIEHLDLSDNKVSTLNLVLNGTSNISKKVFNIPLL